MSQVSSKKSEGVDKLFNLLHYSKLIYKLAYFDASENNFNSK